MKTIKVDAEQLRALIAENQHLQKQVTLLQNVSNIQLFQVRGGRVGIVFDDGETWSYLDGTELFVADEAIQRRLEEGEYPKSVEKMPTWSLAQILKLDGGE